MLKAYFQTELTEAGCDEAGRGCYAGPVYAAAVILPRDFRDPLLNDSKQLTEKQRYALRERIQREAVAWGVASLDNHQIDSLNILQASIRAMHLAIDQLRPSPGLLLVDGNRFTPYGRTPHRCIVRGDATYASIAAASILAKTYRDDFMLTLHREFPVYGWDRNKGYGTAQHREAIERHGLCKYHRLSFRIQPGQAATLF
ncbi:MAG TPA: ribonuclease HII [Chitinophagaceae bacterium]|nr:ribonuclease HII [Chitinophagaceae bacterium]